MTRENFIKNALTYEGTVEGSKKHHAIIDTYNQIRPLPRGYKVSYLDRWCAAFVSFLYFTAGIDYPYECGCGEMIAKLQSKGLLRNTPCEGGPIFFTFSHTGIVTDIKDNRVYTLEGNANNMVMRRSYKISDPAIACYSEIFNPVDTLHNVALRVIAGKYGNYPERKQNLESDGYDYYEVQAVVNHLLGI